VRELTAPGAGEGCTVGREVGDGGNLGGVRRANRKEEAAGIGGSMDKIKIK
jgi:hypothetical protein